MEQNARLPDGYQSGRKSDGYGYSDMLNQATSVAREVTRDAVGYQPNVLA